jgi:hypothetical protein
MMTLRSGRIDWEHLVGLAREQDLPDPLGDRFLYLRETFSAPIPRSVIWRLQRERRSASLKVLRHLRAGDRRFSATQG